jgi:hypothetical protein
MIRPLKANSFVNRFLLKPDISDIPRDVKRLRISGPAFRNLLSYLEASPSSLSYLLSQDVPQGPCGRNNIQIGRRVLSDVYYTLPIRTAIPCTESAVSHALSAAGSNQMNPSQYLHLDNRGVDIRPSKIFIYCSHDAVRRAAKIVAVDFQDGRWFDLAEEPYNRTKEVLGASRLASGGDGSGQDGIAVQCAFVHFVMLTSAAAWWRAALEHFNNQIIEYVSLSRRFL